jgi:hypothetical protein
MAGKNPRALPAGSSYEGVVMVRGTIVAVLIAGIGLGDWCAFADNPKANSAKEQGDNEERSVKGVNDARKAYQESLHKLYEIYMNNGDKEKAKWVEEELKGFHLISKPAYRFDDVPGPKLDARENIKEANELFRAAMQYKDHGFGTEYTLNQRRAEILFQELIAKYQTSDKLADAAYELGDLYEGRAYKQYARAALYFERSSQWRKGGRTDARLRAAKLYDKQLNDRNKAIEMYREVVAHDTDADRLKEAEKRLGDLTGSKK